ncbi:ATP-dependent Clp protease ATP-binding subunit [Segatella copri]|uniref:ATP-dependent Clp protease ATP-binding subunit n=1 Tax=Segatella copri TaxID=165179 RepID=UPI003F71843C
MINPFSHIQDILNRSSKEAARTLGREISVEHLMLSLISQNDSDVNKLLKGADISPMAFSGVLNSKLEKRVEETPADNVKENSHIPFSQITDSIIRDSIREANNYEHSKIVEPRHLLLAILRNDKNPVANWLSQLGLSYDRAIEMLYPTDKDDEQKTEEPKDFKMEPQTPDSETPDADRQEEAENLEMAGGIETEDDYNEQNDMMETDEEPFDMEKDQNPMRLSTRSNGTPRKKSSTPTIDKFSFDLTKAAAEGKLDPVVGREKEIQRVLEILGRRKKNNPVLIGEPGVGKSAIVEGLAQLINNQETSPMFFNKRLVSLDLTAIVAGTKFRGQFEERIKNVIKELEDHPEIIIFIDEIHTMIGAGSGEGSMDAANILKPALARGIIQCIGATTLDEYRKSIEKDGALERRFQKVIVEPTTREETLLILHNIKEHYEKHHCVRYTDEALETCVKLTERYITDRHFPDKAIDVIDEVGSRVHINNASVPAPYIKLEKELKKIISKKQQAVANQNFEMAASCRDAQTKIEKEIEDMKAQWQQGEIGEYVEVTAEDIANVISMMTGVPTQRMAKGESKRLKELEHNLKHKVIAQDNAINKMVKTILRNRVGLRDPNHPIGVFMFLGPTGVGKTYLAQKLAEEMFGSKDSLIRIDMSEFSESFNASRLVGAPPGYVGYNEGGQLTEKVRRKPYSIVLLDEIEKANSKVFNLLLQVLDEGRLTDGNGRLIDFRNTIIIMTSNAGTRQLKDFGRGVGFTSAGIKGGLAMDEKDKEYARSIVQKSLSKQFAPEFLNRLDDIITFDQLDLNAIKRIIDLDLEGLVKRIEDLGFHFQITEKAKEMVAKKGYDVQFGARPLRRAIQTYIEDSVCEMLLDGTMKPGDTISVGKNSKKEELTFKKL